MQKVVRKTALARNQAQRKAILGDKRSKRQELKSALRERFAYNRAQLDRARDERKRREDDWLRGPLAPRHDAGLGKKSFGALLPQEMNLPKVPEHLRRRFINFAAGDRVCVIKGREKGKISEVSRVDEESQTVTLKDLNVSDVAFPEWLRQQSGNNTPFTALPLPIPMDDLRLVVALDDPETGTTRDHVVEHVYGSGPFLEREYGDETPKHTRYIAGENIEIPWPSAAAPEQKDGSWDTLRMEVETPSWTPSLNQPPFPSSVMDELRNKYSKYRTRHDPEYVREKKLEEYKKEYLQSRSLMTPRGELLAKKKAEREEALKPRRDEQGNMIMNRKTVNFIQSFMEGKVKSA